MFKVLFLIDHAPNYRESFLVELSKYFDLAVVAHPCEKDKLVPPRVRGHYRYYELRKTRGSKLRLNFELQGIIRKENPDIINVALNFRYPLRFLTFLLNPGLQTKWVWWGQIFGRNDNMLLINLKKWFIKKSSGVLVYSDEIADRLQGLNVISFNNSQYSEKEFVALDNRKGEKLNCLFVGRPQKRKRLEILCELAKSREDLSFRFVGPGMEEYFRNEDLSQNIQLFSAASGEELRAHFQWSNLVVNPGHVGLLVMNAACHNRPIVIDSEVRHAPEVILAKESNQFFIDFTDPNQVNDFFDDLFANGDILVEKGQQLFGTAISKYTVERMALNHKLMFDQVISKSG